MEIFPRMEKNLYAFSNIGKYLLNWLENSYIGIMFRNKPEKRCNGLKGKVISWFVVAGAILYSMWMVGDLISLLNSFSFLMG